MDSSDFIENGHGDSAKHSGEKSKSEYNPSEGSIVNGISNGLDKHKKKEHRDKDRDRDAERKKEKDRNRDKEHKDKHRDKDRNKEKEHRHSSSSHRDKDKEKSKDGHSRDKEKHREKEKHRDEKKEHSSSQREKDKSSSSKDHNSSKHNSSSSKHSSSKDKHSSSSSKDKDKHKDRDRKHSSDKKHSSSSKDKDRKDKDRKEDKHRKSGESKEKRSSEADISIKKEELSFNESAVKEESFDTSVKKEDSFDMSNIKREDDSYMSSFKKEESDDEGNLVIKEEMSDDDVPLSARKRSAVVSEDDEDDKPLAARKKAKKEKGKKRKKSFDSEEEDEDDFRPAKKKTEKKKKQSEQNNSMNSTMNSTAGSPRKKKKQEEEQEVWKWWEEEKKPDGVKWNFLEHKGPVFAPPYEPLPSDVKFYYNGKEVKLSEEAEEVATFYARMIEHDYTTKEVFNKNFMKDWRKTMTSKEKDLITDLSKCNFKQIHAYFVKKSEERKAMSKEEKQEIKRQNEELIKEYGFCTIDGHKEKIGNFKIEPPSLFRGRGEHPKMGMLKRRVVPEDVSINCSKDSKIPKPPPGHKWKEIKHDNTVTWLASWTENVQGQVKYVMLNPSSKLKGEKDFQKYEIARKLAKSIDKIRRDYREDWKSKEMKIRQRAVAMYFIDKLALRAGNEKDEDQADTVGCCSLRVEHIQLIPEKDGKQNIVVFDFLGKDSIRYYNEVEVEKRVFKNLQIFMEGKDGSNDLFDRLNTSILNKHLTELMDGLTAKVFRTYNASWTLQQQLNELTKPDYTLPEMCLAYNRANRAVAILCNHQRSVPKSHQKSMENLKEKITAKKEAIEEAEKQYKIAKKESKRGSAKEQIVCDKKKTTLNRLKEQLRKLELQETDREENKTIALGTSKLNYLDPRISVAWCKKYNVPIDKVYNKTQRDKFRWAIDMAGPDYVF